MLTSSNHNWKTTPTTKWEKPGHRMVAKKTLLHLSDKEKKQVEGEK